MGSFNGTNYILRFSCGDCSGLSTIDIDPANQEDVLKLGRWLQTHSANGGSYTHFFRRHNALEIAKLIEQGWVPEGDVQKDHKLFLVKDGMRIDTDGLTRVK